jgi:protein-L-isoaspartate(D-aspartate) O-methyltransferase
VGETNGTGDILADRRLRMVERQIERRGVEDTDVLAAMRTVPRHLFVPESEMEAAYDDGPLPIGHGQTISQPYVVASMTEELGIDHTSRVLEIGTGCGYQTAVLAEIAHTVYTIEYVAELLAEARKVLNTLHYSNIEFRVGDGTLGWPEEAPFDGILVTAAAAKLPPALVEQLDVGGKMVIPLEAGRWGGQELTLVHKTVTGISKKSLYPVRFVPLVNS